MKLITRLLGHRSSNYQECIHFSGNFDYINSQVRNYICSFITKMLTLPTNQLFHLTLVVELPWDERQENEEFISELLSKNVNDLRQPSACRILQLPGNLNCSNHTRNSTSKAHQELHISPLSLRLSLWGSPWIFLLFTGIFPSLTCCSLTAVCKRSFFPHLLSHLLSGCRILALLSEY